MSHHIEFSSIPVETCPYCQRNVARHGFTTGDGVVIITYHCAEHGDVIPRRHPAVRHDPPGQARETLAPLTFCHFFDQESQRPCPAISKPPRRNPSTSEFIPRTTSRSSPIPTVCRPAPAFPAA